MRRPPFPVALVAAWAAVLAVGCGRADPPPSIVILSVDTLRRAALRAYDPAAVALPAFDDFAAESVRFDHAFTTASWTLPSHASLLTGLYPDRHGATHFRVTLSQEVTTLAEALGRAGYQTVGLTDGGFLTWTFGFDRGFERYDARVAGEGPGVSLPREGRPTGVPGSALFDRAIALLESRPADAPPLFLFLQTFSVHDYFNLRPWARKRVPESEKFPDERIFELCLSGQTSCEASTWKLLEDLYDAELTHLDAGFARLRDALEAAGLWESSVVFLVSDHGEGFDPDRGRIHHGGRLHADLIQIPFLVRMPGGEPRIRDELVSLVDVMPTVLALANAPAEPGLDGRSLAPLLTGEGEVGPPAPILAMEHMYGWQDSQRVRTPEPPKRSLSIAVIDRDGWYLRARRSEEFYDWRSDPRQERDLAGEADLEAYRRQVRSRPGVPVETEPMHYDAELRDQLRALGYSVD